MMGQRLTCFAAAGLAAIGLTAGAAHGLVIDDFTEGPISLSNDGPSISDGTELSQTDLDPDRVIGGNRYGSLRVSAGEPVETPATLDIAGESGGSGFQFHAAAGDAHSYFDLIYGLPVSRPGDGDEVPLNVNLAQHGDGLLLRDLVVGADTNFHVQILTHDLDDDEHFARAHRFTQGADLSGAATDLYLAFDDFSVAGTQSIDLTRVVGIQIGAGRLVEGDHISFSSVSIVPEPGSLALLGLGGMVLLTRRRRIDITA